MSNDDEDVLGLAALFAAAAVDGDWSAALDAFADATGATDAQLIGVGADYAIPFNWMPRTDPKAVDEFVAINAGDPAVNPRVLWALAARVLDSVHDLRCSTDEELRRNFEYADYCLRYAGPYASQTTLLRKPDALVGLLTFRSEAQGVAQGEDARIFETLAPHIQAAVKLQIALDGQGTQLLSGSLEAMRAAAFICDGFGRVRALTTAAEAMVKRGPLRLADGRLGAARPADTQALEAAIAQAVGGADHLGAPARRTLIVRTAEPLGGFEIVEVAPLPPKPYGLGFEARAVVTVRGQPADDEALAQLLQTAFALSAAEAEVVAKLASGTAREVIAAERGVALDTVRMQIKRAFAKLNVHREAELFALIGRLR
jgi:DNA-binding CsgD family transcriptional regulator